VAVNKRRKKADMSILIKAIVFIVVIILAALLMLAISKMASEPNKPNVSDNQSESSGNTSENDNSDSISDTGSLPSNTEFATVTVDNQKVFTGDLILVNDEHPYIFPSDDQSTLVSLYENKSSDYKTGDINVKLQPQAIQAMNSMMSAFKLIYGRTDLTIMNGYRSLQDQQKEYDSIVNDVGEAEASTLVSKAGASDHHTGLAMDFIIVTSTTVSKFSPTGDYSWVVENTFRYGLIQRYKTGKEMITGMENRDAFYRYVGLPHSYVMNTNNYSLDEYIIALKTYRYDSEMLEVEFDGANYKVYYYPADSGSSTVLPIPNDCTSYSISGNNIDGFIITAIYK